MRPAAVGTPAVRWSRLGDIGLCLLFSLVAIGPIVKTYDAATDGNLLLALHFVLSGGATCIMAGLLLIRRQAVSKATQLRQRSAAIIGTFTIIPLGLLPLTWQPDWLLELTSVAFVMAYSWIVWSLMTLRRSFGIFPEARGLVTHGPYRLVRHPLYAAYFLTYTLVMIPRFSLLAVALTGVGIVAEVIRSRNEEGILRRTYPNYDNYARTVPAFVPLKRRQA